MANHAFYELQSLLARGVVLAVRILWTGGLPVLQGYNVQSGTWQSAAVSPFAGSFLGTSSVTRNGAGDFTVTLDSLYVVQLVVPHSWENATGLVSTAPNVAVKTAGTNTMASGGGTIELITGAGASTSTATAKTGLGTAIITGATVSWSTNQATISAGGAVVAKDALVGGYIDDGTTRALILGNSALTATTGTIDCTAGATAYPTPSGTTVTIYAPAAPTIATAGAASVATDPANGDILNLLIFLSDTGNM